MPFRIPDLTGKSQPARARRILLLLAGVLAVILMGPGLDAREKAELRTVPKVDLARYMGEWFEIARYPNAFQKGLVGVIASYALQADGTIAVINRGRSKTLTGPEKVSRAKGRVVDGSSNTRWRVQFLWPFQADYWIIDLGSRYEYAVVGQPSRNYLWILSRQPRLDPALMREIRQRLRQQGYDPKKLVETPQPLGESG